MLYTNPRGSTGYGEKFLWATWGGWGGLDYEDVMAGVDYVVAHYPVDPKRLGVTGYSYGGFLTNWIITQTHALRRGDRRRGHFQLGQRLRHRGHSAHEGERVLRLAVGAEGRRGPAEVVADDARRRGRRRRRCSCTAKSDLRVPIEQAEQMYTALKKRRCRRSSSAIPTTTTAGGRRGTRCTATSRSWRGGRRT